MAQPPGQVQAPAAREGSAERADPTLARELSELARNLDAERDPDALLARIVTAAAGEIDGAKHAGISLQQHGELHTPVATSDLVIQVDQAQYETGQGPGVQSALEHMTVVANDLATDERWPSFASRATALGIRSMLSFQLFVDGDDIGALNLYAEQPNAFDGDSQTVGLLLAAHAAIAMAKVREGANLRIAVAGRDLIGQAKGILMERYKITADDAFALLVGVSQRTHRKLRDIAEHLAATGELISPHE